MRLIHWGAGFTAALDHVVAHSHLVQRAATAVGEKIAVLLYRAGEIDHPQGLIGQGYAEGLGKAFAAFDML
ncbi:hypothetical protein [Neptunicoccus cionae]|uniref:hypothetical protein n=1 Tax=Neptunicoccus cionae TaxID=2035344 RepID=UPI00166C206F|nr:hypothetical protein [Amylibacter cionae]